MKKLLSLLMVMLFAVNAFAAEDVKKVFINQLVEYPALDMTTKGIIDGLEQNGYRRGIN